MTRCLPFVRVRGTVAEIKIFLLVVPRIVLPFLLSSCVASLFDGCRIIAGCRLGTLGALGRHASGRIGGSRTLRLAALARFTRLAAKLATRIITGIATVHSLLLAAFIASLFAGFGALGALGCHTSGGIGSSRSLGRLGRLARFARFRFTGTEGTLWEGGERVEGGE